MFRQPGRDDARESVVPPLPPDLTLRIGGDAPVAPAAPARRQPARSRDERRLARIDRKVAKRDRPQD